jgi:hypothetical protein
MRSGLRRQASLAVFGVVAVSLLGGCDAGSSGQSTSSTAQNTVSPIDRPPGSQPAPTIKGTPAVAATAGRPYSFQPTASAASGAVLKFSIANMPTWARFNTATGKLSGTPPAPAVGTYRGIGISVSDGTLTAALPAFAIAVTKADSVGAVTLSWEPPTENTDGSQLADLHGYKVLYGTTSRKYSDSIKIDNPGIATYVVENLPTGHYYFAVMSINAAGGESSPSGEVSAMVN